MSTILQISIVFRVAFRSTETMKPRDFVISRDCAFKNCVYTVIPVINDRILDLPFHLQRLEQSFPYIGTKERYEIRDLVADSCLKQFQNDDISNGLLTICLGLKGLTDETEISDNKNSDRKNKSRRYQDKISRINDSDMFESDSLLYPMSADFLSLNLSKLIVDIKEYTRRNPKMKASSWPLERVPLEIRGTPAIETIMYRKSKRLDTVLGSNDSSTDKSSIDRSEIYFTEGLTSNFFVCQNDHLITAPEEVTLTGSMARLVAATAESLGIKIERKMPEFSFSEPSSWNGAFITSATKPIRVIERVLGLEGEILFDSELLEECEMITIIRKKLDSVLRDQENRFLSSIPYNLWSPSISSSTTREEIRETFKIDLL